jgi:hypothetical protein
MAKIVGARVPEALQVRFTAMDEFTGAGLAIDVAVTISTERVIGVLSALVAQHGALAY